MADRITRLLDRVADPRYRIATLVGVAAVLASLAVAWIPLLNGAFAIAFVFFAGLIVGIVYHGRTTDSIDAGRRVGGVFFGTIATGLSVIILLSVLGYFGVVDVEFTNGATLIGWVVTLVLLGTLTTVFMFVTSLIGSVLGDVLMDLVFGSRRA